MRKLCLLFAATAVVSTTACSSLSEPQWAHDQRHPRDTLERLGIVPAPIPVRYCGSLGSIVIEGEGTVHTQYSHCPVRAKAVPIRLGAADDPTL